MIKIIFIIIGVCLFKFTFFKVFSLFFPLLPYGTIHRFPAAKRYINYIHIWQYGFTFVMMFSLHLINKIFNFIRTNNHKSIFFE